MTLRINDELRTLCLNNGIARNISPDYTGGIGSTATMKVYTGTQPASANNAATGTLLVTVNLPATVDTTSLTGSAISASPITLQKYGTWQATITTSGTAGWFRIEKADTSVERLDGSISTSGGGGDLIVNTTTFSSGATFTVSSVALTSVLANGNLKRSDWEAIAVAGIDSTNVFRSPLVYDRLAIYSGTVAGSANDAISNTVLCTIILPSTFLNTASSSQRTIANGPWTGTVVASGTATFFRCYYSAIGDDGVSSIADTIDRPRLQGTITTTGGGGIMELDSTTLTSGGSIQVSSFTVQQPAS